MNDALEILDLVDSHNHVIGQIRRGDYYANQAFYTDHSQYIRGVNAMVLNQQGQLWVPIRSQSRSKWPGGFDFGVGEHVRAGESYDDAFSRGLSEELRLNARLVAWRSLGNIGPNQGLAVFCESYLVFSDQVPHYNREEFSGGLWLQPTELLQRIHAGAPHKGDLLPFLIHFQDQLAA